MQAFYTAAPLPRTRVELKSGQAPAGQNRRRIQIAISQWEEPSRASSSVTSNMRPRPTNLLARIDAPKASSTVNPECPKVCSAVLP
jgi:hypothetical protein